MKKGCLLLLTIIMLIYGYQAYIVVDSYRNDVLKIRVDGKLSDITGKVLPVPLETPDSGVVRNVKHVRRDGDHLFMLSDNRLLHFNMKGEFINQIACEINEENDRIIVGYVLNTNKHQALVIDNERNMLTFDYSGNLISSIRIDKPWYKLTALVYHDGFLWATADTFKANKDDPASLQIEHKLYQLDLNMNELNSMTLRSAGMYKNKIFNILNVEELLVDEYGVYAYSTISDLNVLLNDTLHIVQQKKIPLLYKDAVYGMACVYPVRKGKRFYISTNFCYDDRKQTAYMLTDGFKDDFFKTGYVSDLQPMDIYNDSYCFLKSGKDIAKKFPDRADDSPVLFILKLNV